MLAAESQPTDFSPTMRITAARRPLARRRSTHQANVRQTADSIPRVHTLFSRTVKGGLRLFLGLIQGRILP